VELRKHLSIVEKSGKIQVWSPNSILSGSNISDELKKALNEAEFILLLISVDFLSSSLMDDIVQSGILEKATMGLARILPLIIRPSAWTQTPLGMFPGMPRNGETISTLKNRDKVLHEIVSEIQRVMETLEPAPKWRYIIEKEEKDQTKKLDLGRCGLTQIPTQVKQMTWLETLILGNNVTAELKTENAFGTNTLAGKDISETLNQLVNLKNLSLSNLKLPGVPSLPPLPKLEQLDLSVNEIEKIPTGLNLPLLRVLSLNDNKIKDVRDLDLPKLTRLSLNNNQITKVEGLDKLKSLKSVHLDNNKLNKMDALGKLPASLQELYLNSNDKIDRIEGLETVVRLNSLCLANNAIKEIEGLGTLLSLKKLELNGNDITRIQGLQDKGSLEILRLHYNKITTIEGLTGMKKLRLLDLSGNKITQVNGIDTLQSLKELDLSGNQLTRVEDMSQFPPSLEKLVLNFNPITNINPTVLGTLTGYNCINDLKSFFAETIEINVPEVKLILTGNSDVGKTKFRVFFCTGTYDNTRSSTHGLEVHPLNLSKEVQDQYKIDDDVKINIWDFGGQEYFHNTHQLFFNQHAVYVFLWEKETNRNAPFQTEIMRDATGNSIKKVLEHFDANYWLSNIRHFASEATIVVVQNKVDKYEEAKAPLEWMSQDIMKKYNCNSQHHISINKSAEKDLNYWYDFEKLKHAIFRELKTFISQNKEGNIYNQVRKEIEKRKADNFWKVEDFIAFMNKIKSASSIQSTSKINDIKDEVIIGHFCRQGKILYPNDQALVAGKVIFTNPQWLSSQIYRILNDSVLQRNGFFDEVDLQKLVTEKIIDNESIMLQIIELMKEYNIVFFNRVKKQYVAPQYLPEVPTVHFSQVKKLLANSKLIIKVDGFLPKSTINNIIATYAVKNETADYYKYGVKTETGNGNILLIEANYAERKLYVYANTNDATFLRNVFSEILKSFDIELNDSDPVPAIASPSLDTPTIQKPIEYKGNNIYISIDDKIFVEWLALWNQYIGGERDNAYCIAEDGNMVLRKVYESYYKPYSEVRNIKTDDQVKPAKLFISYSSKNTDFMRRFITHLEPLKLNGSIEFWHDRMIEPGAKWDDSIKEQMKTSDLIIFLLSPDFLATRYIFDFEIPQSIKQFEEKSSKLFFVELQSCGWRRTILKNYQQLTLTEGTNKTALEIGEATNDNKWRLVIDEIEKKLEIV
jgi:internalin A